MNGTSDILDKINNLTSDESLILESFNKRIDRAQDSKNNAEEEKKSFEKNIKDIQKDIDDISKASELNERFANIDTFMPGLEKLGNSVNLLENLKSELKKIPERIEELESNIKELTDKVNDSTNVIKNAEDELSKLDMQLSDAKRYQENLIELIELAKTGNINKTRDEVIETLAHVGFEDSDAMAAAKIILFPEDDLIPYFENKDNAVETTVQNEEIVEEQEEENNEIDEVQENEEESFVEPVIEDAKIDDDSDTNDNSEIVLEDNDEDVKLSPVDVAPMRDFDKIKSILTDNGFDCSKFNEEDLDVNEELLKENVEFLKSKDLNIDFVYDYPSILGDNSLKNKYSLIIDKLGKTDDDIKLSPEILVSYSSDDIEKLIDVLNKNDINPKLIPLSMYLKGLQPLLRNYIELKENNIVLDDDQISKFAPVLSLNPVDFKKSLQILLDYHVNLKKSDGKIALMDLTLSPVELANRMDMIINVGEEDLLKYYPEVLVSNIVELVNRLLFLKRSEIPYKTVSHNKCVYQSFVLRQEVLDKVLEKKVELNEILDRDKTNSVAKKLLNNEELIDELDKINDNFELASNNYLDDYVSVLKTIKGKYKETENSYVISGISFSKNKVNRSINYLLSIFGDASKELVLLASLLHDSRLSEDNMNLVLDILNLKVK